MYLAKLVICVAGGGGDGTPADVIKTEPLTPQWKNPSVLPVSSTPTTSPKPEAPSLKRPYLPAKDYEVLLEEETMSGMMYDYTVLETW